MKPDRIVLLVAVGLAVIFMIVTLAAGINCALRGETCPPQGTLREVLEDLIVLLTGFLGGRATAKGKS